MRNYVHHGYEALLEGHRSERNALLSKTQLIELGDIIDRGYGYSSAIWTSIMIRDVIQAEFSVNYHLGHIKKLLNNMGFSVQKPKIVLARTKEQDEIKHRL